MYTKATENVMAFLSN